jgi:SAM-dependent methyltransferase
LTPLQAELYALTHRGNPGDASFYARACAGAASVLELGVGYGRLLPALARASGSIVGLDREPMLLRAARRALKALPPAQQRRVTLVRGEMQAFDLGRKFERILLPYNGLYCLQSSRELLSCLHSVRTHLAPGGEFVFDVWAADLFHRDSDSAAFRDDDTPILSICRGKQLWDVFESSRLRKPQQRLDVLYSYVAQGRRPPVSIEIKQRYALSSELFQLLAQAGLEPSATYGGFTGQRFSKRSEELVVRARASERRESDPKSRGENRTKPTRKRNRAQETSASRALATKGKDKRH